MLVGCCSLSSFVVCWLLFAVVCCVLCVDVCCCVLTRVVGGLLFFMGSCVLFDVSCSLCVDRCGSLSLAACCVLLLMFAGCWWSVVGAVCWCLFAV